MSEKSVVRSIRLPRELQAKVLELAKEQRRSFSYLCAYFIEQAYQREIKAIEKAKGGTK